jgi:hypothetical protein
MREFVGSNARILLLIACLFFVLDVLSPLTPTPMAQITNFVAIAICASSLVGLFWHFRLALGRDTLTAVPYFLPCLNPAVSICILLC